MFIQVQAVLFKEFNCNQAGPLNLLSIFLHNINIDTTSTMVVVNGPIRLLKKRLINHLSTYKLFINLLFER